MRPPLIVCRLIVNVVRTRLFCAAVSPAIQWPFAQPEGLAPKGSGHRIAVSHAGFSPFKAAHVLPLGPLTTGHVSSVLMILSPPPQVLGCHACPPDRVSSGRRGFWSSNGAPAEEQLSRHFQKQRRSSSVRASRSSPQPRQFSLRSPLLRGTP